MASSPTVVAPSKPLEDPLAHLPCSSIVEYKKGQMIYNQDQPSTSIYLVIDGKVKVSRLADDGHQVVVDIYQTDEFFGESALLNLPHRAEQATALENTKLMTWTTAEIEDIVMKRPRLAVALLQILVQRTIEFGHRIESFSVDNIAAGWLVHSSVSPSAWVRPRTTGRCAWCRSRTNCSRNMWERREKS
jgi:CRP/FNR family cyclic AMP-dependent transcriptional regulator